jgi:hypothetical protein
MTSNFRFRGTLRFSRAQVKTNSPLREWKRQGQTTFIQNRRQFQSACRGRCRTPQIVQAYAENALNSRRERLASSSFGVRSRSWEMLFDAKYGRRLERSARVEYADSS